MVFKLIKKARTGISVFLNQPEFSELPGLFSDLLRGYCNDFKNSDLGQFFQYIWHLFDFLDERDEIVTILVEVEGNQILVLVAPSLINMVDTTGLPDDAMRRIGFYNKAFRDLGYHFNLQLRFCYGLSPCSLTAEVEQSPTTTIVYVDIADDPKVSYHVEMLHQAAHYMRRSKKHETDFNDVVLGLNHRYLCIKIRKLAQEFNALLSLQQEIVSVPDGGGDGEGQDLLSVLQPMLLAYNDASTLTEGLSTGEVGGADEQTTNNEWKPRTRLILWGTFCHAVLHQIQRDPPPLLHDLKGLEEFLIRFIQAAFKEKRLTEQGLSVVQWCTRVLADGAVKPRESMMYRDVDIDFWCKYSEVILRM